MNIGTRVKIVNVEAEFSRFAGREGVVSSIYPCKSAPFPIYVTFDAEDVGIPFARDEVEVV